MHCKAIILYLATIGSAAVLSRRDVHGQLVSRQENDLPQFLTDPPIKTAYKTEQLTPQSGVAGAQRIRLIHGPFQLRGNGDAKSPGNVKSMDRGGTAYSFKAAPDFPTDVTILSLVTEIQTAKLVRARLDDGIYNHHNIWINLLKTSDPPVFACSNGTQGTVMDIPIRIIGGGATEQGVINYYSTDPSVKAGLHVEKDSAIFGGIDTVNYNKAPVDVYTNTEIEFLPSQIQGYRQTIQTILDPGACSGTPGVMIHPPEGQTKFKVESKDIIMNASGTVVRMRGHVHDGGLGVVVKVNDKVVCESTARYGGEGHTYRSEGKTWETIAETSECAAPFEVKKGDKVSLVATYDTGLHPSREMAGQKPNMGLTEGDSGAEQMALAVLYFAEAKA